MTGVFRSDVLAVVMQQIVDELVLPVLFLLKQSAAWAQHSVIPFNQGSKQDVEALVDYIYATLGMDEKLMVSMTSPS
jgi:hypothetical protein